MRKTPFILLLVAMMLTLTSHTPMGSASTTCYSTSDTTKAFKDSTKTKQHTAKDTSVAYTDTLSEVSVEAQKGLRVVDAINKSLNKGPVMPGQKSVSDILGSKATDYIMHPFAWKDRKKDKKLKKDKENLKKYDAITSYEDELTKAINRQLREDSIANAKKKQK